MREDVIAASCAIDHISLLDPRDDKEQIKKLLERANSLAGDNFDVLQMCVLSYIAINEIEEAKNTLKKLINEDYNVGLNGLLLSRIYCKFENNKTEYDILKKRIGETSVMPWIEDDEKADKEYIEYRKKDIVWRFKTFLEDISLKYSNLFIKQLGYNQYINPVMKITWFNNINIVEILLDLLNEFFDEIAELDFFKIKEQLNKNSWDNYFRGQASLISELINKFNEGHSSVKEFISQHETHPVFKYHKENLLMSSKIDELVTKCNFTDFTNNFIEDLDKEFNSGFSVKKAESADSFINCIDSWYVKNELNAPRNPDDIKINNLIISNKNNKYFLYEDIIKI
jgi:hypothetical protein